MIQVINEGIVNKYFFFLVAKRQKIDIKFVALFVCLKCCSGFRRDGFFSPSSESSCLSAVAAAALESVMII
jgi:hypothetical protein